LERVDGEHPERRRNPGGRMYGRNTTSSFACHVIEVRRFAADHRAQADDRIDAAMFGELACCDRNLEAARNPDERDAILARAMPQQRVDRAVDQTLRHDFVEAPGDDAEPHLRGVELAAVRVHGSDARTAMPAASSFAMA